MKNKFMLLNSNLKYYIAKNDSPDNWTKLEEDSWDDFTEIEYKKFLSNSFDTFPVNNFNYGDYSNLSHLKIILSSGTPILEGTVNNNINNVISFQEAIINDKENKFYFIEFNHPLKEHGDSDFLNYIIARDYLGKKIICFKLEDNYYLET